MDKGEATLPSSQLSSTSYPPTSAAPTRTSFSGGLPKIQNARQQGETEILGVLRGLRVRGIYGVECIITQNLTIMTLIRDCHKSCKQIWST